ncbi:MAG TPA: ATP-binding protein [Polyangiaceae bacterium LLY-WYZ-14_1]|nr:ATP-binding protein [Polyangiaceae bacterium LLY-WYZ-14_1]
MTADRYRQAISLPARPPDAMADVARLEEVVDREALGDVCRSFFELFGISVRVFSKDGALLADVHQERTICRYVNTLGQGRLACASTVSDVKQVEPDDRTMIHPCFTGAVYRVVPIDYQGRRVGRFILGPYLPAEVREVPQSLLVVDPELDAERARGALAEMPRVKQETADRIGDHLRRVIDLILFSSHQAHLTSEMHVASVRESFRELAEKTTQLQRAYDELKELDRLKSNFLATVSHELRTPLTSIIGYSEMLTGGIAGEMNAEQMDFVETIRSKGDQLLTLITSLLDLSRLEQGTLSLKPSRLDPRVVVQEVADTLGSIAHKKAVTIELDIDPDLEPLEGDPVRVKQVITNLGDNAIKFTPREGRVRIAVRGVDVEAPGSEGARGLVLMSAARRGFEVVVQDSGMGIPASELEKIFDAFYQVDGSSTRTHGGAGLGLSIVKRLVEAHGGSVRVESEVGRGTSFTVTFAELSEEAAA